MSEHSIYSTTIQCSGDHHPSEFLMDATREYKPYQTYPLHRGQDYWGHKQYMDIWDDSKKHLSQSFCTTSSSDTAYFKNRNFEESWYDDDLDHDIQGFMSSTASSLFSTKTAPAAPTLFDISFLDETPDPLCNFHTSIPYSSDHLSSLDCKEIEESSVLSAGTISTTFSSHESKYHAPPDADVIKLETYYGTKCEKPNNLQLKLNCHSRHLDGPTYWGMWEDERARMVYVSWLPRAARANDRTKKKRCELILKDFIIEHLGFSALQKVLLFPPSSAHCKLLFGTEEAAVKFLTVFGGMEGYPGPALWKSLVCQYFSVNIRSGIYATKVRIIWADQTKNDAFFQPLSDALLNNGSCSSEHI